MTDRDDGKPFLRLLECVPGALPRMWERTLVNVGGRVGEVDAELWAQQVVDSNFT